MTMIYYSKTLKHHGILGQKWGDRNGPPYPLSGGDYSSSEKREVFKARKKKNSIYNKKHFDQVLKKGTVFNTLSYDKDRTKNTDMFYAAHDKTDKHLYNSLFNRKIPQEIYDENGNSLGTGMFYKYRIQNAANSDIKVASEDSGAEIFKELYRTDRDFYNFVRDSDRMQKHFVDSKYKFKGYRESRDSLEKIRKESKIPSEDDIKTLYRMFNYTIPSDGGGNSRMAKDIATQRAKFFKKAKEKGYGAILDTNDAIYGGFKANSPVIVIDMDQIYLKGADRVTTTDKYFSDIALIGRRAVGL